MKKFGKTIAAILAACTIFNLTGCSPRSKSYNKGRVDDLVIGAADGGVTIEKSIEPIELADNNTLNSIRLFDAISADKENAMFSPLSLNMALGLLEAGAEGETKAALESYLQTENFSDFAEAYMKLAREEYTFKNEFRNQNNVLEIANSFWADHALPLKTDYKQRMSEKFDAEIQSVDFSDKEKTLNKINGWVNDKTHNMIPSVLGDYDDATAAILVNTVYFESAWLDEWTVDEKDKEHFTLFDGTIKDIPLMYNDGHSYFENDKAAAFSCNYMNGLHFIGILPKETGEFTLEGLDIPSLLESETYDYDVSAVMPRFTFDTAFALKDALSAAGLSDIFDENCADFSGISEDELFVTEILQKTRIELDEYRTKASAATVGIMNGTAEPMQREHKTVRLDRPFAFLIYDSEQDQILFMGKVTNIDS